MAYSSDNNPGLILGKNPLAYQGVNPYTPPDLFIKKFPPTTKDGANMQRGAIWINVGTTGGIPTARDIWMLVSQAQNVYTWVNFAGGSALETLTAIDGSTQTIVPTDANQNININSGLGIAVTGNAATNTLSVAVTGPTLTASTNMVAVPIDGADNINIVAGSGMIITGDASTNTVTFASSTSPEGTVLSLTGTTGGAISPDNTGTINILGETEWLKVTGTPLNNTLTIEALLSLTGSTTGGAVSYSSTGGITLEAGAGITIEGNNIESEITFANTGVITVNGLTPSGGDIEITGGTGITVTDSGHTVTVSSSGVAEIQGTSGGPVGPNAEGIINLLGSPNHVTVVGVPSTNTLTVNAPIFLTGTDSNQIHPNSSGNFNVLTNAPSSTSGTNWMTTTNSSANTMTIDAPLAISTSLGLITTYPSEQSGSPATASWTFSSVPTAGITVTGVPDTSTVLWVNTGVITINGLVSSDNPLAFGDISIVGGTGISVTSTGSRTDPTVTIASTQSPLAGAWVLIQTQFVTNAGDVVFNTNITDAFLNYVLFWNQLECDDGGLLLMQFSNDGGSTYPTSYCVNYDAAGNTQSTTTAISFGINAPEGSYSSGSAWIYNMGLNNVHTGVTWQGFFGYGERSAMSIQSGSGTSYTFDTPVNAFRLISENAQEITGQFTLYGITA